MPDKAVAKVTVKRYKRGSGVYVRCYVKRPMTIKMVHELAVDIAVSVKKIVRPNGIDNHEKT